MRQKRRLGCRGRRCDWSSGRAGRQRGEAGTGAPDLPTLRSGLVLGRRYLRPSTLELEVARVCDDVLLVDQRGHELEAVPPYDRLDVVRVGPERVEHVIGTHRDVGVVADEATAKAVGGDDRMRG